MLYDEFFTGKNYGEFIKLLGSQFREFLRFSKIFSEIVDIEDIVEVYVKDFFLEGKYNNNFTIYAFTKDKFIEINSNEEKDYIMTFFRYSSIEIITFQNTEKSTNLSIKLSNEKYIRFSNDDIYNWKDTYKDLIIAITKFLYSKT